MPDKKRMHVDAHELRALLEQAPDAYFLHDFQGQLIDVNRRACDSLGYSREELLQLSVFDIEQAFDLEQAQKEWAALTPGEGITLTGQQRRRDGSIFPVEWRLSVCMFGEEKLYMGLARDCTERKTAGTALRTLADRYQTLFESIDEGFCVIEVLFDAAGQPRDYLFIEVNPAFEKHVGLLGAVGKTIRQLVPDIEKRWIEIYGEVALTGRSVRFREFSASLQRSFDVYAFRLGSEGSARVAILFANITERLAAEEALKKSERLALIGTMAGVISHEINNPLDAVQNLLYMAELEENAGTARSYVQLAQQEVTSAARIVAQTLRFTRQAQEARPEKLSDVLDSAITLLQGKSKRAGVLVERFYMEQAEVLCLSSELRQVFANLLSNAFDASQQYGKVAVRVRDSRSWDGGEAGVRVTIADYGCGMSVETREHLFQPFYTTKGENGTGLGLWVSHEILARHRVRVSLKSRQGATRSGTVFSLWFPVDHEPKSVDAMRSEEQSALLMQTFGS